MTLAMPAASAGQVGNRIACALAAGALLIALAVLAGWVFDVVSLTSLLPGLVSMKPVSALTLALCALSLGLYALEQSRAGSYAALLVFGLGVGTLAEIAFDIRLGIDQLLMQGVAATPGELPSRPHVGRRRLRLQPHRHRLVADVPRPQARWRCKSWRWPSA
jgi:hypothetical protein